jgi:Flp pilus assembly protein TadG
MAQASSSFRRAPRAFGRDERGIVAATIALLAVPLVLAMGVAVDGARVYLVRSRLAQAVDAATLAGAQSTEEAAILAEAQRLFDANFEAGYLGSTVSPLTIQHEPVAGTVSIVARAQVPTMVMQLARLETVEVEARATAIRRVNGLEVALVLDVTGSMAGSKIASLKQAAEDLIEVLFGDVEEAEELAVAVVPFSARVNIGTSRSAWTSGSPSGWIGCVESRGGALALSDDPPSSGLFPRTAGTYTYWDWRRGWRTATMPCPVEMLPLSNRKSTLLAKIASLSATGTTRIDMGARWGWRALSERWAGLWGTAGSPLPDADDSVKAVVLMTDGENVASSYDEVTAAQADTNTLALCTAMKLEDYVIYSIAFQAPTAAQTLLRSCASSESHYYESPTEEDLRAAFKQIAGRLSELRLVQ